MRLQVIDPAASFACHSCGACCDQPWRTVIESTSAHALDQHDWSRYPNLVGRRFYHPPADGREGFYDLAKGEGTRCVFLDGDGLCIIHKEMGPQAKPAMCRQFPFVSSRTWIDERVSVNFGCPSVQQNLGAPIASQSADIARLVPTSGRPQRPDARITLTGPITLNIAENDALIAELLQIFDDSRNEDIWSRFAQSLAACAASAQDAALSPSAARSSPNPPEPRIRLSRIDRPGDGLTLPLVERREPAGASSILAPVLRPPSHPSRSPLASRMLFAATLHPDTVPADVTGRMGLGRKLTLIPRLMSLAQLSGGYASRLLGRNISIEAVLSHEVAADLDPQAARLLLRYFRSRFWQRVLIGTRMSIVAGLHQHILDFNAILFFARAEAHRLGKPVLDEPLIRLALTCVEFHLANQPRLGEQVLRGWFRRRLDDIGVALASLAMLRPCDSRRLHPDRVPAAHA